MAAAGIQNVTTGGQFCQPAIKDFRKRRLVEVFFLVI